MAIIAIVFGSYCHGEEVIARVSKQLDYKDIVSRLFNITSQRYNVSADQLLQSLVPPPPPVAKSLIAQELDLAYLQTVLAELMEPDKAIISGCPAFLIPANISHVLRVCLIADVAHRRSNSLKIDGGSEDDATARIKDDDLKLATCAAHFSHRPVYDESLYDIVIPMDQTSVSDAAAIICEQAQSEAVATTERSREAVAGFRLASEIKVALLQKGWRVEVFAEAGHVIVGINDHVLNMKRLQTKIERKVMSFPGVTEVTTKLGSKYSPPSANPWNDVDVPPRILLVDDEKEFVQTLSERLRTRSLESTIAYNGEQALEMLKSDVADVIVLDLRMPGIDGIETLRRVKKQYPGVEVIILTGHGSKREQEIAEELGAFAYLQKPVNVNELARVMKAAYMRAKGKT